MAVNNNIRGGKIIASNNIYTAILAFAIFVVLTTSAFVAYKCYAQYGTLFQIP